MPELDLTQLRETIAAFAPQGRSGLLPALHAAQSIYGWIPEPVAAEISRALNVPLADIHGVIEFYSMFYNEPIGQTIVRVCTDPACATRDADEVLAAACRKARVDRPGETSADGRYTVERSPCLGLCNTGVGVCVTHQHDDRYHTATYGNVRPYTLDDLFAGHGRPAEDYVGGDICIVTALCGRGHTASLIEYEAAGGMRALRRVFEQQLTAAASDRSAQAIGLAGPRRRGVSRVDQMGKRDESVHRTPKYFVINADESEPGTFKDRILLEGDPCRIIEGAIIGAYTIGAQQAYIYIRGEYPRAIECMRRAIEECKSAELSGPDTSSAPGTISISKSDRARARTSAAKRRRCSNRSKASAAFRA